VPEISARIVQVLIANNQQVEKGAPLIVIDPVPYELALPQARAEVAALKAQTPLTGRHGRRLWSSHREQLPFAVHSYWRVRRPIGKPQS
jgi:multidrug efflux pump subunit AcrA (membrane-fusion protein)